MSYYGHHIVRDYCVVNPLYFNPLIFYIVFRCWIKVQLNLPFFMVYLKMLRGLKSTIYIYKYS